MTTTDRSPAMTENVDLLAALMASIERAKQQRADRQPCDRCGGDRLRADFTTTDRCHAPMGEHR